MAEIEDLKRIVKRQSEELARSAVSREASGAVVGRHDHRRDDDGGRRGAIAVGGFVQRVRTKVDDLYMDSNNIDKEFCEM